MTDNDTAPPDDMDRNRGPGPGRGPIRTVPGAAPSGQASRALGRLPPGARAIRALRTKGDHAAALAALRRLMFAAPGTPEGDRYDLLAVLVEAYEKEQSGHGDADAADTPTVAAVRAAEPVERQPCAAVGLMADTDQEPDRNRHPTGPVPTRAMLALVRWLSEGHLSPEMPDVARAILAAVPPPHAPRHMSGPHECRAILEELKQAVEYTPLGIRGIKAVAKAHAYLNPRAWSEPGTPHAEAATETAPRGVHRADHVGVASTGRPAGTAAAALAPFAKVADLFGPHHDDSIELFVGVGAGAPVRLTLAHFRAARAAIAGTDGNPRIGAADIAPPP